MGTTGPDKWGGLTARVVCLIGEGRSAAEIAGEVSPRPTSRVECLVHSRGLWTRSSTHLSRRSSRDLPCQVLSYSLRGYGP